MYAFIGLKLKWLVGKGLVTNSFPFVNKMLSALVKKLELMAYSSLPSLLIKVEGTTTPLISCPSTIFEVLPCGRETFLKALGKPATDWCIKTKLCKLKTKQLSVSICPSTFLI